MGTDGSDSIETIWTAIGRKVKRTCTYEGELYLYENLAPDTYEGEGSYLTNRELGAVLTTGLVMKSCAAVPGTSSLSRVSYGHVRITIEQHE